MLRIAPNTRPTVPELDGFAAWKHYLWFFYDAVGCVASLHERFGKMVILRERIPFRRSVRQCIFVSGAEYSRQVLSDPETFNSGGVIIRGPKGSALNKMRRGLITVNGHKHRDQRKMMSPLFMPKAVREYYPAMVETVRKELDDWQPGTTLDVFSRACRMALLMSVKSLLPGEDSTAALRLAEATNELLDRSFSAGVLMFPLNVIGTPYYRLLKRAERLQEQALKLIDSRPRHPQDAVLMLDRLVSYQLSNSHEISREDLAGQLVTMFAATHETTPKAIAWTMFLLAQHPNILAELHDELRAHCGDEPPSYEDLINLPLLNAVTKETLRILPPAPLVVRRVRGSAMLGPLEVSPGDYVVVNHFGTHRDPEVFADPDQFRPERWFDATPDNFEYLPFGAGPRTCIAKTMGLVTINLIVAMATQRFRLSVAPHSRIDRSHLITMAPKFGMPMRVKRHNGRFEATPITGNVCRMVDLTRSDATTRQMILRMPERTVPTRKKVAA
ncbi:MAG: cytochrome P450 [Pirellulales bacterium]